MCGVADSPGGTEQRPDHKILVFYENLWTFEILVMERCSTTYKKKDHYKQAMAVCPSNINTPNINIRSLRVRNSGLSLGQLESILGYKRFCKKQNKTKQTTSHQNP